MKMHNDTSQSGISILEVILVVTIIGITSAIAVPNIMNWADSRTINNDLSSTLQAIDFSRSESAAQGRTYYIIGPTPSKTLDIHYAKDVNPLACPPSSGADMAKSNQYPGGIAIESTITTKHGYATPGTAGEYAGTNQLICFSPDGMSSGGGFQLVYGGEEYRIDVLITGFYDIKKNLGSPCPENTATTWCERN